MGIKEIDYKTNFGNVKLKLNELMDKKGISISTMSKLANVKSEILAKFCYILDCEIDDILIYETSEDFVKQG